MTKRRATRPEGPVAIWERPERPAHRRASDLSRLSRERIVRAAISLADKEGLVSVSLRKVGAALNAGPMRLYGYVSTKEELLELMVDEVYAEMAPARRVRGDWRRVLRSVAQGMRRAAIDHPWFVELLGGRPRLGPNALAHLEASLAALCTTPRPVGIDGALQAGRTISAYVIGATLVEAGERRAELDSGLNETAWQRAHQAYLLRMVATDEFPMLERVMREASDPSPDEVFERGLECVLDGLAATLGV